MAPREKVPADKAGGGTGGKKSQWQTSSTGGADTAFRRRMASHLAGTTVAQDIAVLFQAQQEQQRTNKKAIRDLQAEIEDLSKALAVPQAGLPLETAVPSYSEVQACLEEQEGQLERAVIDLGREYEKLRKVAIGKEQELEARKQQWEGHCKDSTFMLPLPLSPCVDGMEESMARYGTPACLSPMDPARLTGAAPSSSEDSKALEGRKGAVGSSKREAGRRPKSESYDPLAASEPSLPRRLLTNSFSDLGPAPSTASPTSASRSPRRSHHVSFSHALSKGTAAPSISRGGPLIASSPASLPRPRLLDITGTEEEDITRCDSSDGSRPVPDEMEGDVPEIEPGQGTEEQERYIRRIVNQYEKAVLKGNEAGDMGRTYEYLISRLKDVDQTLEASKQEMVQSVAQVDEETKAVRTENKEAVRARELAQQALALTRNNLEKKRREQEEQLAERKGVKVLRSGVRRMVAGREASRYNIRLAIQGHFTQEQGAHAKLEAVRIDATRLVESQASDWLEDNVEAQEAGMKRLMAVTMCSDLSELVHKACNMDILQGQLEGTAEELREKMHGLKDELQEQRRQLEELQFTGGDLQTSRRRMDSMDVSLSRAQSVVSQKFQSYERLTQLLLGAKVGVQHLAEQLGIPTTDASRLAAEAAAMSATPATRTATATSTRAATTTLPGATTPSALAMGDAVFRGDDVVQLLKACDAREGQLLEEIAASSSRLAAGEDPSTAVSATGSSTTATLADDLATRAALDRQLSTSGRVNPSRHLSASSNLLPFNAPRRSPDTIRAIRGGDRREALAAGAKPGSAMMGAPGLWTPGRTPSPSIGGGTLPPKNTPGAVRSIQEARPISSRSRSPSKSASSERRLGFRHRSASSTGSTVSSGEGNSGSDDGGDDEDDGINASSTRPSRHGSACQQRNSVMSTSSRCPGSASRKSGRAMDAASLVAAAVPAHQAGSFRVARAGRTAELGGEEPDAPTRRGAVKTRADLKAESRKLVQLAGGVCGPRSRGFSVRG